MLMTSFFFLGFVVVVLQGTLFQHFPVWLGRPDLGFILVAFVAYRFRWIGGLLLVFVLGWMMDVVSGIYLGTYPLQYILVFVCLRFLTEQSPLKEAAYQVPLVGVSYFLVQIVFFFFYSLLMPDTLPGWSWGRAIRETIVLLIATIPFFLVFNALYEFFLTRRVVRKIIRKRSGNEFR